MWHRVILRRRQSWCGGTAAWSAPAPAPCFWWGETPPEEVTENIFAMSPAERQAKGIEALPGSLEEALIAMKKDRLVMAALGQHVTSQYIAGKEAEWQEYCTRVSSWERDKYIINY